MTMWLLKILARLPLGVLYVFADVAFVILYHIVRYRRKVVCSNLGEAYPDKSAADRRRIERRFYRHFADITVETIKMLHISDAEMARRMQFVNCDIADGLLRRGRSVAAYFAHIGNWEWASSVTLASAMRPDVDARFCQIYRPLRNAAVDRIMLALRSRFGAHSLPKTTAMRALLKLQAASLPSITGFMSDQKPSHGDTGHYTMFLNRPTAIISGTETLARRLGMAAVYWDMEKLSRGHYRITMRLIADDVAATDHGYVTETYARMLEASINRNPEIWLWSHNRWKHPVAPELCQS